MESKIKKKKTEFINRVYKTTNRASREMRRDEIYYLRSFSSFRPTLSRLKFSF